VVLRALTLSRVVPNDRAYTKPARCEVSPRRHSAESLLTEGKDFEAQLKDLEAKYVEIVEIMDDFESQVTELTCVEELYFDEVIDRERFDSKKKEIDERIAAIKSELDEI
jgi:t-SNARE complex subunit (syntaxin)